MRLAVFVVLLALAVLFGPWDLEFGFRVSIAGILVAVSFYLYMRFKFAQWRAQGKSPGPRLVGRIIGAALGAVAAMLGGVLSAMGQRPDPASHFEDLLFIGALSGAVFGLLLGAAAGVSDDRLTHVLVGAVSGGFGGMMSGAMAALFPGTSSGQIIFSALTPGLAGAISGALLGLTWRRIHQLVLAFFPWLGEH
jgi:hypothetical protein